MENIEKNNSLETAKNRLDISGLTYLDNTTYVYDRVVKNIDETYKSIIPIVENNNGQEILRYKNLMYQYYWLIHEFIPTCNYKKLCKRDSSNRWIVFDDYSTLRGECIVKFLDYNHKVIDVITILKGQTITNIPTPTFIGHTFNGWYTSSVGGDLFDFTTPINEDVVVYAQYDINQYNVVFKYYDSSISEDEQVKIVTVNYNDDVPYSEVPNVFGKRDGYTFKSWDGDWHNVTEDRIITAEYKINEYLVQFFDVVNPSSEILDYKLILSETVKYNRPAATPKDPIYQNFVFEKWVDINGDDVDLLHIKDDIDVYPKYVPNEYTVIFVDWDNTVLSVNIGGEEVTSQTVEYKGVAVTPTSVTEEGHRPNYVFSGWSQDVNNIVRDCTIVAKYSADLFEVTFLGPDNNTYKTVSVAYNGRVTKPIDPQIEEYDPYTYGVFEMWCSDSELENEWDFNMLITENTTIYSKFKGNANNPFIVTFYNWDNTLIDDDSNPQVVAYGESADDTQIKTQVEPKEQYTFIGWSKDITNVKSDLNVIAKFNDVQTYVVRFIDSLKEEGEEGRVISTVYVQGGTSINTSDYPTPTVEYGYDFDYWEGSTVEIYENKDIIAKYKEAEFTINFLDYNKNVVYTTTQKYLETCKTPIVNVDVAYDRLDEEHPEMLSTMAFNGTFYYLDDSGVTIEQTPEETVVYGNTNFIAQYDIVTTVETHVNIVYKSWDSSYVYTDEVLYAYVLTGERLEEIKGEVEAAVGSRGDSYVFQSFQDEKGNEYKIKENGEYTEYTITDDITLTMRYDVRSLIVTFKDNVNDDVITEKIVLYNNKVTAPTEMPEIQYYTFSGNWYKNQDCTLMFDFDTKLTSDMTLYAKYVGNIYTISFNSNGGSIVSSETLQYPNPTTKPADPTKQGYTFDKWYSDEALTTEFIFGKPLTEHITLYAGWGEQMLTVSFNSDGGSPTPSTQTVAYGSKLQSVATVTKSGYDFDGWYNGSTLFNVSTDVVTSNMTLKAKWVAQGYNFTINYTSNSNLRTQFNNKPIENADIVSTNYNSSTKEGNVVYRTSSNIIDLPSSFLQNTYDLLTIELPDVITGINQYAFAGCTYLTSINLGSTSSIGSSVFSGCSRLTTITSMGNVNSIGTGAFDSCVGLQKISLPNNIRSLGNGVFMNCTNLTSVTLGSGITTLGAYTFQGCTSLSSVNLSKITTIGNKCFDGCSSLTQVSLNSANTIESYAFQACSSLNEINIGNPHIITISSTTFNGLPNSGTLYYNNTTSNNWTSWQISPFYNTSTSTWKWDREEAIK